MGGITKKKKCKRRFMLMFLCRFIFWSVDPIHFTEIVLSCVSFKEKNTRYAQRLHEYEVYHMTDIILISESENTLQ